MINSIFTNIELRDWIFDDFSLPTFGSFSVAIMGSGPFDEDEMDEFLKSLGIEVFTPDENSEIVILGMEGWTDYSIDKLLSDRLNQSLKVYSQEMFLTYLLTGKDPFDLDEDSLMLFTKGHPGFERLLEHFFEWPTTFVKPPSGSSTPTETDFAEKSPLGIIGYSVAKAKGKSKKQRHSILSKAFKQNWSPGVFLSYPNHNEWGEPDTSTRLYKIASHIAFICKLLKRRRSEVYKTAISRYETDLDWLKGEYYTGRFDFKWPKTN